MYKIIGADLKEYGPITADQLRQWIAEGRINASTKVQAEGDAVWKSASEFPEFVASLRAVAPPAPMTPMAPAPVAMAPVAVKTNQVAVWSMVTGIIAILPCCWGIGIMAVISIVLGCIALPQIKKTPNQTGAGFAIAGIILGVISIILSIITWVVLFTNPDFMSAIQNAIPKQ